MNTNIASRLPDYTAKFSLGASKAEYGNKDSEKSYDGHIKPMMIMDRGDCDWAEIYCHELDDPYHCNYYRILCSKSCEERRSDCYFDSPITDPNERAKHCDQLYKACKAGF